MTRRIETFEVEHRSCSRARLACPPHDTTLESGGMALRAALRARLKLNRVLALYARA